MCPTGVTPPSPPASTYAWPRDSPLAQVCALPSFVCSQSSLNIRLALGLAFATIVCQTKWPTLCDCIAAESPTHKRTPLTSLEQFASACQTRCQTCLTVLLQASIPHTTHSAHKFSGPVHRRVLKNSGQPYLILLLQASIPRLGCACNGCTPTELSCRASMSWTTAQAQVCWP